MIVNPSRGVRALSTYIATVVCFAATSSLSAQPLPLKRVLVAAVAPGCPVTTNVRPATQRDNAAARRLATEAQEAALVGDRAAARDAYQKAAALDPTDDRIAYALARAHEELNEAEAAIREYCRYLTLSPEGRESAEVRNRLARLTPPEAIRNTERALEQFKLGISNYDRAQFAVAEVAFDDVIRQLPNAPEALYNRGIVNAAMRRNEAASRDLQAYLKADPNAPDRLDVVRAIEILRRPAFDPGTTVQLGLFPGMGQFYTRRPAPGVLVLAGVAGAAAVALNQRVATRTVPYVDPNGVPVPYEEEYLERPYLVPGLIAAGVITVAGALEAYFYARSTQRGVELEPPRGINTGMGVGNEPLYLAPLVTSRGAAGLALSTRFR